MGADAIVALDAGTSAAKALLVSLDGTVLARASIPVAVRGAGPSHVEQDPESLADAVIAAGVEAMAARPDVTPVAVAISNQRESVVAWSARTGAPLGPLLSWQDARTAPWVATLPADVSALVRRRTGLTLDALYSAPKMRWLLDSIEAPAGDIRLGTVDSWLVHRLSHEWVMETGNASRTLLLDLQTGDWDDDLLDAFGIPSSTLPPVVRSDGDFGVTLPTSGLPAGLPIVAVLADSHAALYAHSSRTDGAAKATYGTGTSVMVPTSDPGQEIGGVDTTVAWWDAAPFYAREGNILATGQAVDWTAAMLGNAGDRPGGAVIAELAEDVSDSGGVAFVPAFTGLGSPHWDRDAAALITGMTAATTRGHIARAALESVAHQVADLVEAIRAHDQGAMPCLHVDGGASSIDLLVQVQADLIGIPVVRSRESALSALGAAHLAARTLGSPLPPIAVDDPVAPTLDEGTRAEARAAWHQAVRRSRSMPSPTHLEEDS